MCIDIISYLLGKKSSGGGGGSKYAPRHIRFTNYNGTELDYELQNLDTSNITDFSYMFSGCEKITSLDLSKFDTSNATSMESMFRTTKKLNQIDLSTFDTHNVTSMNAMFMMSSSSNDLTRIVFGNNFDTSNATDITGMFSNLANVETLDLSRFNLGKITACKNMFNGCTSLSNATLNAILGMLATATKLGAVNKTLKYIGLSSEQATTCIELSNWEALEEAGWTTGY